MTYTTTNVGDYYVALICPRCGGNHHLEKCPQVRAIEYHDNGKIKRVEFVTPPPVSSVTVKPPDLPDWHTTSTAVIDWTKTMVWYNLKRGLTYGGAGFTLRLI